MRNFLNQSRRRWLIILFVVVLTKGWLWASVIPLFQAPDEQAHFSYVQYWVENGTLPKNETSTIKQGSPQLQKTLEDLEWASTKFNPLHQQAFAVDSVWGPQEKSIQNARNNPKPTENYSAYTYPPAYYVTLIPAYLIFREDIIAQAMAMRFTSVLIYVVTILLIYGAAHEYFKERQWVLAVTLMVLFHPMVSFMASVINNDAMLNLAYAGFFFSAIKSLKRSEKWNRKELTILACWTGLGILSKTQGYGLVGLLMVWFFYKQGGFETLRKYRRFKIGVGATALALLGGYGLKRLGWGGVQNYPAFFEHHSFYEILVELRIYAQVVWKSFWGHFGWVDTLMPSWFFGGLMVLILMACSGWAKGFLGKEKSIKNAVNGFLFVSIGIIVGLYVFYFLDKLLITQSAVEARALQGRYYFILMVPFMLLGIKGIQNWSGVLKEREILLGMTVFMIAADLYALLAVIIPRYYV